MKGQSQLGSFTRPSRLPCGVFLSLTHLLPPSHAGVVVILRYDG
jgi:hypothetical protein